LGSKDCPAANNERDFRRKCIKELNLEIPPTPEGRFNQIIKDVNDSLQEKDLLLLAKQIGL
jgi:hypothetical protein